MANDRCGGRGDGPSSAAVMDAAGALGCPALATTSSTAAAAGEASGDSSPSLDAAPCHTPRHGIHTSSTMSGQDWGRKLSTPGHERSTRSASTCAPVADVHHAVKPAIADAESPPWEAAAGEEAAEDGAGAAAARSAGPEDPVADAVTAAARCRAAAVAKRPSECPDGPRLQRSKYARRK